MFLLTGGTPSSRSQGRDLSEDPEAGTEAQSVEEPPLAGFFLTACSVCLPVQPRVTCTHSVIAAPTEDWSKPHQSFINQEDDPQTCPKANKMETIPPPRFQLPG